MFTAQLDDFIAEELFLSTLSNTLAKANGLAGVRFVSA